MTVVQLPTLSRSQWTLAEWELADAVERTGHPRLEEHLTWADRFLADAPAPNQIWANRIAAIAVIADRRADVAPTRPRRAIYLDAADAAHRLLDLAYRVHGAVPDETAQVVLAGMGQAELEKA